jgi:GTP-binding protein
VVNKIDRPNVDPNLAVDKVFDLFVELGADDDQCDFTTLFASGMQGFAKESLEDEDKDMQPLFEAILHHVPPPGTLTNPYSCK